MFFHISYCLVMGRPRNRIPTTQIQVAGNPRLDERLDQAIDTGLCGKNRAEAAERLIALGWLTLHREGLIEGDGPGERDRPKEGD